VRYDPATNSILFDPTPVSEGRVMVAFPGDSTSVSTEGGQSGIFWDLQTDGFAQKSPAVKFTVPALANGMVFVGTQNQLDIYGLKFSDSGAANAAVAVWSPRRQPEALEGE
jgi:hypothetical protein